MGQRGTGTTEDMPAVDWRLLAHALAEQVERVTALLRSLHDPAAPAVGQWSAVEVAMHLSQAWIAVPGLADDDLSTIHEVLPHLAGTAGASLIEDMWDLGDTTMAGVRADPERDPVVLAERIDERARAFLDSLHRRSLRARHAWLVEGVVVTLPTLIGHLLNETTVHGYDIATADGRRWPIPNSHAALIFDGFLVPVAAGLPPRTLVDQDTAAGLRATFDLHVRGGGRHLFTFDHGELHVERPGSRPVDCHLSVAPAAILMLVWGRRSQWPAIATGQLVAWGRKPWLGPRLSSLLRNP